MKVFFKGNKGINLISLTIAVTVIMILTGIIIVNATSNLKSNKLKNMQADIENLRDKVSNYYAKYGDIPADRNIEYTNISDINSISNAVDTGAFYVIDLAAMENLTLNYGKDYERIRTGEVTTQGGINQLTDLYIINADSHNIFYVEGIELDGEIFYTDYGEEDKDMAAVEIIEFLAADGSWNDKKGCNTPVIKDNMKLVKWDGTDFVPDNTNSSYDYDNQQWANAVVTIDGIESYFVWIPRYEYKINYTTPGTPRNGGTIEIKFIPTSQTTADLGYTIHPAFTTNVDNGGWGEEIPGIWVGKYETSLVKKSDGSNINTSNNSTGNFIVDSTNNTDKAIAVQPGMSSWRYCTIGNMYTSAKAYSTSLNSHMLKNSEWGAVAYLTQSKYGRNGTKVTVNDNNSYITADEGISTNPEQSSTGNETGIYDLSGGAYEYVASYLANADYSNANTTFTTNTSDKYSTVYPQATGITGDATSETEGWNNELVNFIRSTSPFFIRGGDCYGTLISGIFSFGSYNGASVANDTFRMCLAVI